MVIKKLGQVKTTFKRSSLWNSHFMAPSAVALDDNTLHIFVGGWSDKKISRIWSVDVKKDNPLEVCAHSETPHLDIGDDGCFDENGVFPAHSFKISDQTTYLHYTGFQLGHKIRHYNFGGLAISQDNGKTFSRYSKAPTLDRADEGLFVRAGQSIEKDPKGGFHCVYSAGSSWFHCANELRPVYDVFYQHSNDGIQLGLKGEKIISANLSVEHGLGRPQIIKIQDYYWIFYTRRIIENMKYFSGCARSKDLVHWENMNHLFDGVDFGKEGDFDSKMIYFPCVIKKTDSVYYIFYSGNNFGETGMGVLEFSL